MPFLRPILLAALVLVAACTKQEPTARRHVSELARQPVPDALGRLVPPEAVALVRFDALDTLEPKLSEFGIRLDPLLAMAGVARDEIDGGKPLAVALIFTDQGQPIPKFILPLADGTYATKPGASDPGTSVPELARDLPGGDVVLRADLKRLIPQLRPVLDEALDPAALAQNPALAADPVARHMVGDLAGWAKTLLDSGETLEAAAQVHDGRVDFNLAFTVREGSALDTPPTRGESLGSLARSFDARSHAMVLLLRADWSGFVDTFMPFYESLLATEPQAVKDAFRAYVPKMKEVNKLMGTSFVTGCDFGDNGMRIDGALQPDDPALYLARYKDMLEEGNRFLPAWGVDIQAAPTVEIDGVTLDVVRMKFDFKKLMAAGGTSPAGPPDMDRFMDRFMDALLGPDGIPVAQGIVGGRVLMTTAPFEGAVKVAKAKSGELPPAAAAALTENTSFLCYVDVQRLLAGISGLLTKVKPERSFNAPGGGPIDLWLRGSQTGRTYEFGVHVDVAGIRDAVKSMR